VQIEGEEEEEERWYRGRVLGQVEVYRKLHFFKIQS
jgi:hypothetical protein